MTVVASGPIEAGIDDYYALLPDGSVWWWRREVPSALMVLFGWLLPLLVAMEIILFFAPLYLGAGIVRWSQRPPRPTSVSA